MQAGRQAALLGIISITYPFTHQIIEKFPGILPRSCSSTKKPQGILYHFVNPPKFPIPFSTYISMYECTHILCFFSLPYPLLLNPHLRRNHLYSPHFLYVLSLQVFPPSLYNKSVGWYPRRGNVGVENSCKTIGGNSEMICDRLVLSNAGG